MKEKSEIKGHTANCFEEAANKTSIYLRYSRTFTLCYIFSNHSWYNFRPSREQQQTESNFQIDVFIISNYKVTLRVKRHILLI